MLLKSKIAMTDFAADSPAFAYLHINRLALDVSIGVYPHERFMRSVYVSLTAKIPAQLANPDHDHLQEVVDYDELVAVTRQALPPGTHIHLLESLCHKIATACLQIKSVLAIRVCVEKTQAMAGVESVSVEIIRERFNIAPETLTSPKDTTNPQEARSPWDDAEIGNPSQKSAKRAKGQ